MKKEDEDPDAMARADAILANLAKRRQDRIDAEAATGGTPIETRTVVVDFPFPIPVHLLGVVDAIGASQGMSQIDVLREFMKAHAEKMLVSILAQLEAFSQKRN